MQLQQVVIAYKEGDRRSKGVCQDCATALRKRGITVLTAPTGLYHNPYPVFLEATNDPIDLAIVLGGDGSTLAAARYLAPHDIPILPIKVGGHLGFLAQSEQILHDNPWDRIAADDFLAQLRIMLQARILDLDGQPESNWYHCLNEICVKPTAQVRLPSAIFEIEVDREILDQYHGDGLIVSTPTGSTSYTVAANGPIVHPSLEAISITPICPLSLSSRPIVIDSHACIKIWPLADPEGLTRLWNDGVLARAVNPGQHVEVCRAERPANFIVLEDDPSFFRTLREKLQWAGSRFHVPNTNHRSTE
ncbi:NAD(+) kinase [Synechococcus sp. PCC 7336]|uniref:NAD(+) kinase n=1 Tax=Synechococcus sp. PCC 7336 TaxID=195250 RepID=UPI0003486DA6|nr:NAD(+) kinase [Synechococcus sp. PCC 7336]